MSVCSIKNCSSLAWWGTGYCRNHYRRFKLYGDPFGVAPPRQRPIRYCFIQDCKNIHFGHGLCHKHYDASPEKIQRLKNFRINNRERINKQNAESRHRIKTSCISHYSLGKKECACCGERLMDFLTIDHINGGGHKHNMYLQSEGTSLYCWLKKNNYPLGYQVLCMNCNWGKRYKKECPHKMKQIEVEWY